MSHNALSTVLLCAALALSACVQPSTSDPSTSTPLSTPEGDPLIYGADDRREVYELTDSTQIAAAASTVALFDTSDVSDLGNGSFGLTLGSTFGAQRNLCTSEPYRSQPAPAYCSGFQIGEDLIATAGHCVDAASCGSTAFVFGFEMLDASTVRAAVGANDVYTCAQILGRAETSTDDWAVVRVDRPIVGHSPLQIRRSGTVSGGTPLFVSGHPMGLPMKIAGGATVRSNSHPNFFESNLDTYGGNSGSPVINANTGVVEGILVRGNTDLVSTGKGKRRCNVSNVCADSGCPGWEDASRTTRFEALVAPDSPCTANADCDDNNACNGAETCDTNTGDCVAGTPLDCDDGDACTANTCSPVNGCQTSPLTCNDGDACTTDFCDSADGCGTDPVACDSGADGCCSPGCEGTDPDCDGPSCKVKNEACSSSAECCSGNCHRRRNVCR